MSKSVLKKSKKFAIDKDGVGRVLLPKYMVDSIGWSADTRIEIVYDMEKEEFTVKKI